MVLSDGNLPRYERLTDVLGHALALDPLCYLLYIGLNRVSVYAELVAVVGATDDEEAAAVGTDKELIDFEQIFAVIHDKDG